MTSHFRSKLLLRRAAAAALCLGAGLAAALAGTASAIAQTAPSLPPSPQSPPPTPPAATQPATVPAQDLPAAKDIVAASLAAIGGADAAKAVESFRIKASMSMPSPTGEATEVTFEIKAARSGAFLLVQTAAAGPSATIGSDGEVAWLNAGGMGYQILQGPMIEQAKLQIDMLFPYWVLLDPEHQCEAMDTAEQADFGGKPAYKVHFATKGADEPKRFGIYDVEDKQMKGMELRQSTPMGPMSVMFTFMEPKAFDKLTLFTKLIFSQMGRDTTVVYNEVELNQVDAADFQLPADVKDLVEKQKNPQTQPAAPPPAPTAPPTAPPTATAPAAAPGKPGPD